MLAVISAVDFDPIGYVVLNALPSTRAADIRRRVNRIATLDGSAVFNDSGYSDADRTIVLRWVTTSAQVQQRIDRLVRTYTRLVLSLPAGVFLVAAESFTDNGQESSLTCLVASKLNA